MAIVRKLVRCWLSILSANITKVTEPRLAGANVGTAMVVVKTSGAYPAAIVTVVALPSSSKRRDFEWSRRVFGL